MKPTAEQQECWRESVEALNHFHAYDDRSKFKEWVKKWGSKLEEWGIKTTKWPIEEE